MISRTCVIMLFLLLGTGKVISQDRDSVFTLTALVYDMEYRPVPACHIINMNSYAGVVSDSLGIFSIPVCMNDTLLVRNIAYRDTLVPLGDLTGSKIIFVTKASYELPEAKVFEWGSTYGDFRTALIKRPAAPTLGEQLGLPRQDPGYVPYNMDERHVESLGFALSSPISYLYENLNRKARNRRKVYWLKRNRELHERFEEITGPENLSYLTGLEGDELLEFMAHLYRELECDFRCDELKLYSEIHAIWEEYRSDSSMK